MLTHVYSTLLSLVDRLVPSVLDAVDLSRSLELRESGLEQLAKELSR